MRQVFRLMDMPDRVIAFDELPEDLLVGLEMCDCSKLPKDWREFIGIREKTTRIPPDRDPLTGQIRTYVPITQKAPYAYLIDRELNNDKERWQEIESYVRRNAPREFRLLDKIADMAKPMARDAHSELDLEADQVLVIPIMKAEAETPQQATVTIAPPLPAIPVVQVSSAPVLAATPAAPAAAPVDALKCDECEKVFSSKQAVRMHKMKRHPAVAAAV